MMLRSLTGLKIIFNWKKIEERLIAELKLKLYVCQLHF
jgi:hypothetical protein